MENKPTLRSIYINPASGCNLHCKHCWVNEGWSSGELLSISNWSKLIDESHSLGCKFVKITGGEPLLYPDIVPLYRYAATKIDKVSIETNGTIQPNGFWNALSEHLPHSVSVSLDSSSSAIHDGFRGKAGSWKKTVDFIKKLISSNIKNQIIMSISNTDIESVQSMINLASNLGVNSLKINFVIPLGKAASSSFLDNCGIEKALHFFEWLNNESPEWVLPSIPAAFQPLSSLKNIGYCPVNNLLGVLPDGTFSLCGVAFSRKDMRWGKYPDCSVEKAWNSSPVYKKIRSSVPDKLEGVCALCIHRKSCIGRCVVNNLETGGSLQSPDSLCQNAFESGLFPKTRLIEG